jgi:GNAT superfamily N-acetyltransferase
MWSEITATLPEYRGHGLATLVKVAALHWAADRGVTVAYTSNDESNVRCWQSTRASAIGRSACNGPAWPRSTEHGSMARPG